MPEENAAEDRTLARLGAGGRTFSPTSLMIFAVVLAAWTVALVVFLRSPKRRPPVAEGGASTRAASDPRWLDVATMPISPVHVPVRVDEAGMRVRNVLAECEIRLGPRYPEESPDVKDLNKYYVPRLENLEPEFREFIANQLTTRTYADIQKSDVRNQIRQGMVGEFNNILTQNGLEPRIHSVTLIISLAPGY